MVSIHVGLVHLPRIGPTFSLHSLALRFLSGLPQSLLSA